MAINSAGTGQPAELGVEVPCEALWCATAVVRARSDNDIVAYTYNSLFPGSSLSDPDFEYRGTTYTVTAIGNDQLYSVVGMVLDPVPAADDVAGLTLHIGDIALAFGDAIIDEDIVEEEDVIVEGVTNETYFDWVDQRFGESNSPFQNRAVLSLRITEDAPEKDPVEPAMAAEAGAPTVSSLAFTSDPGTDNAYAADDNIEIAVTFSEAVTITGEPRLALSIGGQARTAAYDRGSGTAAVVFAYTVSESDQGDAIAIGAGAISLNGGTISRAASQENDVAADLSHDGQTANQRVDGVRPGLGSATADGATLTLAYGEALDEDQVPATTAFGVTVGGNGRGVDGVAVSGSDVTLTLASAVAPGDTVTVTYTAPSDESAARIRDRAGNAAPSFDGQAAANDAKPPLTAGYQGEPESHDGESEFTFELRFSEEPDPDFSYRTLRDHAFLEDGNGYTVTKAQRTKKPGNRRWLITVQPGSDAEVLIVLPVTTDCNANGAICAADGRMLSNRVEFTVPGPDG